MKVREVKKEPREVTRTLPNFAGQVHHQDKDPKVVIYFEMSS